MLSNLSINNFILYCDIIVVGVLIGYTIYNLIDGSETYCANRRLARQHLAAAAPNDKFIGKN